MIGVKALGAEALQAWRGLVRKPGYLLLAAFTLSLGVATSTSVFSMLQQALLSSLPFSEPSKLVTLGIQSEGEKDSGSQNVAAPIYLSAARRMQTVSSVGMVMRQTRATNLARGELAEVGTSLLADRGFLETLGVAPQIGRNFNQTEDQPGGPKAAIISYDLWQRGFARDSSIVGSKLQVEGESIAIVGVLPKSFVWPDRFDILLSLQPDLSSVSTATNEYIVARLNHSAGVSSASAEADAVMKPLLSSQINSPDALEQIARIRFSALSLKESVYQSRSGNVLWLFLAASVCVLAIAAFNLGNLMLLRSLSRDHESAVRAALGAPALRLALPTLAEAALVGLSGSLMGLFLAWIGLRLLDSWVPQEWLRGQAPSLTPSALLFALGAGVAVAVLGALLGVWRGRRRSALAALGRDGQNGLTQGAGRLAKGLIVTQVAVAAMLLLGASLFALSLVRLSGVPMGFQSHSILTFTLAPVRATAPDAAAVQNQTESVLRALERDPMVARAGASTNLPTGSQLNMYMELPDGQGVSAQYRPVTPGFLELFGIPVVAGRSFDALTDRAGSEPVAVVSEAFARNFLNGAPLGKVIRVADGSSSSYTPMRVVGVVGDVRQYGPTEDAPPIIYVALDQMAPELWTLLRDFVSLHYAIEVRPGAEGSLTGSVGDTVRAVSPGQPIANVQTMRAVVSETTREQRLNLLLVGVFSVLALLLAGVGLYAVMAVAVAARRHEFGVRAALGALPERLMRQVLVEGGLQVGLGLAIGLAAALAASRALERFLFGIDAADPRAIALVTAVLAIAGLTACLIPALRASRAQPMAALRSN